MSRTVCVYFTDPRRGIFGHVTAGDTLMEAASEAPDWFYDPHWHGPRPTPTTVLEVTLVGEGRTVHVEAERGAEKILRWAISARFPVLLTSIKTLRNYLTKPICKNSK